jgi:hypothetical protein
MSRRLGKAGIKCSSQLLQRQYIFAHLIYLLIKLVQAEKEIGFFTRKLHVQMANSHQSPQSQPNTQPMPAF